MLYDKDAKSGICVLMRDGCGIPSQGLDPEGDRQKIIDRKAPSITLPLDGRVN